MNRKPPEIFFDMDGVLVNFDKEFQKHLPGHTEESDWTWQELHAKCPDIYSIAEPMPDMNDLLAYLGPYYEHWHILTAIPKRWNWPDVTKQKRGWVNYYVPEISNDRIRFGPYAEDKQFHCVGSTCILIDDKIRNIQQWENRGGTGIHHISAANTIKQLKARVFS